MGPTEREVLMSDQQRSTAATCRDKSKLVAADAAKQLGDVLVVGIVSDEEILRCKGPPVLSYREREALIRSVKWVDEIVPNVPYDLSPAFISELITKHKVDYVLHGDDPCLLPDGTDAYAYAKKLGRFKMIKRTEGVSTTDIVGRMLMCTRYNGFVKEQLSKGRMELVKSFSLGHGAAIPSNDGAANDASDGRRTTQSEAPDIRVSRFLPTSRRLVNFASGRAPPVQAQVVYIDGAFDVFHCGHVEVLNAAKALGNYLLVGLHTDEDVTDRRGQHLPIMDLHERALAVLACSAVDEVIIGAPLHVSEELLASFGVAVVVRGTVSETSDARGLDPQRYAVPHQKGMFRSIPSPSSMTANTIISRIMTNREGYEKKVKKKQQSEAQYYKSKDHSVQEV